MKIFPGPRNRKAFGMDGPRKPRRSWGFVVLKRTPYFGGIYPRECSVKTCRTWLADYRFQRRMRRGHQKLYYRIPGLRYRVLQGEL